MVANFLVDICLYHVRTVEHEEWAACPAVVLVVVPLTHKLHLNCVTVPEPVPNVVCIPAIKYYTGVSCYASLFFTHTLTHILYQRAIPGTMYQVIFNGFDRLVYSLVPMYQVSCIASNHVLLRNRKHPLKRHCFGSGRPPEK